MFTFRIQNSINRKNTSLKSHQWNLSLKSRSLREKKKKKRDKERVESTQLIVHIFLKQLT